MNCQLQTWTIETENDDEFVKKIEDTHIIDQFIIGKKQKHLKPTGKYEKIYYSSAIGTWTVDTKKTKFSYIEKYAYDNAMFHFKRLNINFDENKHFIQFWIKNIKECHPKSLHVDFYTDYETKTKDDIFFSTVTYFDDNDLPTVFTDLTENDALEKKDFSYLKKICFSFPRRLKHAFFLGKKYFHGHWKVMENRNEYANRTIFVLKIWDETKPDFIDYFDNDLHGLEEEYEKNGPPIIKFVSSPENKYIYLKDNSMINTNLILGLIGPEIDPKICYPFGDLILKNDYHKHDTFIFEVNPDKYVEPVVSYKNYYLYTILIILLIGVIYYLYKIPAIIMFLYNSIVTRNNEDISISFLTPL